MKRQISPSGPIQIGTRLNAPKLSLLIWLVKLEQVLISGSSARRSFHDGARYGEAAPAAHKGPAPFPRYRNLFRSRFSSSFGRYWVRRQVEYSCNQHLKRREYRVDTESGDK